MEKYNKIIAKYFEAKDTKIKKFVMEEFKKNNKNLPSHIDSVLFNFGIISVNYSPLVDSNKWMPYLNFSNENIFNEEKGVKDLCEFPVSANRAQEILANKIIELIHFINFEKVLSQLNLKVQENYC